jgi:N-acyl-D-aspartate/D-glutamate deacylase
MKFRIFIALLLSLVLFNCNKKRINADILILNGTLYNGTDTLAHAHCVALKGDKIIYVGHAADVQFKAKRTIDAKGRIVCPGFIDPHTHADRDLKESKSSHNLPFLMQGVTTVVVGSDGRSFFPTKEFKALYEEQGIGTNAVLMTGHGTLRQLVVGRTNRKATPEEITNMQTLVQREMDEGAFGMTTGLFYAPGSYSDTEEIITLAKVVAQNDGIYDTHMRDEGSYSIGLKGAVEEAIEIGRQAQLPIHISHIKCLGVDVWNQSTEIIELIENSRQEGIDVTANQYPYDASATGLQAATVPRWAESGGTDSLFLRYAQEDLKGRMLTETKQNIARRGGADKLLIVMVSDSTYLGKNLLEISEMLELPPEEAVFEVLKTGTVRIASFNMIEEDIHRFMRRDWVMTGSDGNTGHPRKYGSFPRKYNQYVKQEKVIDLTQFINQSSAATAEIFKIPKRGQLKEGYFADIIIFNPDTFRDRADYTDAFQYAEGLEYCIINGHLVVEEGDYTGLLKGRVLEK